MMFRLRSAAPILVGLICLIVLSMRLSGAHAHWDLGAAQETVAHEHSHHVHGHHHDAHDESAHADGQVDIEIDGLNGQADRLGKFSPLSVGLLLAIGLFLIAARRTVPRPPDRPDPRPLARSHWRPQLRGPPALSIA